MPNFLENKQLIHIIVELVILAGLSYFFVKKNKQCLTHISDLTHRLEAQEEKLKQLEQFVSQLYRETITARFVQPLPTPPIVTFKQPEREIIEQKEESAEELDKKLTAELKELEDPPQLKEEQKDK